jgi:hypothetical protein
MFLRTLTSRLPRQALYGRHNHNKNNIQVTATVIPCCTMSLMRRQTVAISMKTLHHTGSFLRQWSTFAFRPTTTTTPTMLLFQRMPTTFVSTTTRSLHYPSGITNRPGSLSLLLTSSHRPFHYPLTTSRYSMGLQSKSLWQCNMGAMTYFSTNSSNNHNNSNRFPPPPSHNNNNSRRNMGALGALGTGAVVLFGKTKYILAALKLTKMARYVRVTSIMHYAFPLLNLFAKNCFPFSHFIYCMISRWLSPFFLLLLLQVLEVCC